MKFKWIESYGGRYEIRSEFFTITAWRDEDDGSFSWEMEPNHITIDSEDHIETFEELLESIDNSLDEIESDMSHLHVCYDDLKEEFKDE